MPADVLDNPAVTISVSLDRDLLLRLNEAARLAPECVSRSQLVRDLLELALDVVLDPVSTLPTIVAGLRDAYSAADETPADPIGEPAKPRESLP